MTVIALSLARLRATRTGKNLQIGVACKKIPDRRLQMLHAILAALIVVAAPLAHAAGQQPRITTPVPGAPGTATPTPYPQITPSAPPKAYDRQPGAPLLPPIPVPGPPRDQPLPGLSQEPPRPPAKDD